ncbi:MAG: desulfoferrodoxin [Oscillospiraceae bacterium]|jgi:superoxide reductase|nr:desulfoferrodoxin [Oscillospiraceae bacterium]
MSKQKFFICKHCGNLIGLIKDAGVSMICCGEKMTQLVPNTVEAAVEKHLPVVSVDGNNVTVTVGSVLHPMTEEHYIAWIYIETEKGGQRKALSPNGEPSVTFTLSDDKAVAVFAYCNIHGLWKVEL